MPELNGDSNVDIDEAATLLDLEGNLEDLNFDDIEDLPGFIQPPDGLYRLKVTVAKIEEYVPKEDNPDKKKKKRISHYYEVVKVLELSDANEQEPKVGDKFSERFNGNAEGLKYWKVKTKAILGKEIGKQTLGNILKELSDGDYEFDAKVTTKDTPDKKDKTKKYRNTNVRVMERKNTDVPGIEGIEGIEGIVGGPVGAGGLNVE